MHGGHSGSGFPITLTIDLRGDYSAGVALNTLKWGVHSNGFGSYSVDASNDGSDWTTLANLNMNGGGSGMSEGEAFTNTWSNSVPYTFWRAVISDTDNAGGKGGFAAYTWQWSTTCPT